MMIYVFLADGFEEVEALTPVDYLRRCELSVQTVGITGKLVRGSHGITVQADILPDEIDPEKTQMIVLPGGMPGTLNLEQSEVVSDMIDYCVKKEIPIGAICAAPSILGHKGLLSGKRATCYTGFEEQLSGAQITGEPVEADGIFITARGAGVADRFAFALIERLISKERAALVRDAVLCVK